jgi:hypothetical protein
VATPAEARAKVGSLVREAQRRMTAAQYRASILKMKAVPKKSRPKGWRAGWRTIGKQRVYFRSRWEANYAAILEFQIKHGSVARWEHEPETFWFEGLKRGTVSYLPDFRVTSKDGSVAYHEVKGRFDSRSKTKIRRMAKYHPAVKMVVIDATAYRALAKQFRGMPWWEK